MKKIFTLFLIALSASSYSQISIGMHLGSSNKNMVAGLHSQYQFNNGFTLGVNMSSHTDNINPAYFQTRFGQTLGNEEAFSIQPYIGYSYSIQNTDQKIYGGHFTTGALMQYQLNDIALLYTDINIPSKKYIMFSVGIAGRFNND